MVGVRRSNRSTDRAFGGKALKACYTPGPSRPDNLYMLQRVVIALSISRYVTRVATRAVTRVATRAVTRVATRAVTRVATRVKSDAAILVGHTCHTQGLTRISVKAASFCKRLI